MKTLLLSQDLEQMPKLTDFITVCIKNFSPTWKQNEVKIRYNSYKPLKTLEQEMMGILRKISATKSEV